MIKATPRGPYISISQYFSINTKAFNETGAFDAFLDIDSKFFIDPYLLGSSEAPEFKDAHSKISSRFEKVLILLAQSNQINDIFWKEAEKLLTFREVKGLCIGYSNTGTSGSGIGPKLRTQILITAKKIVDAGIRDPKFFELLGLFEKNIGPDRISDMLAGILKENLYQYSSRIFRMFQIPGKSLQAEGNCYELPINPFNNHPIILMPRDILQNLPTAETCGNIKNLCEANEKIRSLMNSQIGDAWKESVQGSPQTVKHLLKNIGKDFLFDHIELLQGILDLYKRLPIVRYDYEHDPANQFKFHSDAIFYTENYPLDLDRSNYKRPEKIMAVALTICKKFKDFIENNGVYKLLYDSNGRPKHESASQLFFFCIANLYCEQNNLDLSPESNAGRGPVDFKISSGYDSKILVEIKLTSNKKLLDGYKHQLLEYQKAEKTIYGIYIVIHITGGSEENFKKIQEIAKKEPIRNRCGSLSQLKFVFVDATPKVSASRYKGE